MPQNDHSPTPQAPRLTRLAPTPSGFLHAGNLLSFAATFALSLRLNANILLRIDDLDRDRLRPEYVADIFDTLEFMDIPWHQGPRSPDDFYTHWSQSLRTESYNSLLNSLREGSHVFACDCSRSQLLNGIYPGTCRHKNIPLDQPGVAWRLKTNPDARIAIRSLGPAIPPMSLPPSMYDFVVRKKNGDPAYQLASVADDLHFGITHAVRGNDLLPSSLGQLYLASLLPPNGFADTIFWHHPLLEGPSGHKLSKSAGDTSIRHMRAQGLSPADICTAIARMSDPHATPQSARELGDWFVQQQRVA
ncbi:glutamate--tRNA ligase family protein [Chitinophaga sp.]|uniref:glutamate--tRNA ligase family protein n=1 Tax=Chitinophaga sp. TaxID=1869181 RepID=UPI00260565AD|nr:glutamate--tRNA ligase family protein [uncultured Chitinophaga sp.]